MPTSLRLWQCFLLVLPLAAGDYNSSEICAWDRPRVAIVRDHIYLEGGWLQIPRDGSCKHLETATSSNGWLFNLSLHDSFDISNDDAPALFRSIDEGALSNFYFDGYMFADYDELYAFGYVFSGITKETYTKHWSA